jgi:hypothetical protein
MWQVFWSGQVFLDFEENLFVLLMKLNIKVV